jgi:hypothetical protein
LRAIIITFDRRMGGGRALVIRTEGQFPELAGEAEFDATQTMLTIPVRLKPDTTYAMCLNTERFLGYRDIEGNLLLPVVHEFRTGKSHGGTGDQ